MTEELFRGMGMTVVTGSSYLGGFIGGREAEEKCMAEKVQGWAELVNTLPGVTQKQPYSAYIEL